MKTALSYRRVSTDRQAEKYSLPAQKRINQETAQKLECAIVKEYEDAGCSAGSLDTMPALQQLLSELPETQSDYLLVTDVDRLGRGYDFFLVLKKLIAHDISIYTEAGKESELVTGFRALIGLEERKSIIRRIRRGKVQAAQEGRWGGLIYGYQARDGKLVPHPQEHETVKLIFDWAEQGYGGLWIARVLNARNIPSKEGKTWWPMSVSRLLQNRTLIGEIRHGQSWHRGHHEAIVDSGQFERVQSLLKMRKLEGIDRSHKHFLSGFLYCGRCGRHLTIRSMRETAIYACTGYMRGFCRGVYVSEARLQKTVPQALFSHTANFEIEALHAKRNNHRIELRDLKAQIKRLDRQIEELMVDFYERRLLRQKDYISRYQKLTERQEQLEKEISLLEWQASQERKALITKAVAVDLQTIWYDMEIEEQRQALKLFVEKIIIHPDLHRSLKEKRIEILWR